MTQPSAARIAALAARIREESHDRTDSAPLTLMHVCGTHEHEIGRHGIRALLPPGIRLLAGPGCPVCVTPAAAVLHAAAIARRHQAILATFGDMVRVPAAGTSLAEERARGLDLAVVQGPAQALALAQKHPERKVIFFSPGFETTAAPLAALLATRVPENLYIFPVHRLIPPGLAALLGSGKLAAEGLILPGHVLTITGTADYDFLPRQFGLPAVVTGFEAEDILASILWLVRQRGHAPSVGNLYPRSVRAEGNPKARALMDKVFETVDADWRGIGLLPRTGLALNAEFARFDAARAWPAEAPPAPAAEPGCRCGEVLLGAIEPRDCRLFGTACVPDRAIGPCMVSEEGTCRAAWIWRRLEGLPT